MRTLTISSLMDARTEAAVWQSYLRPDTTPFLTTDTMWSESMPGPRRTAKPTWRRCVRQKLSRLKGLRRDLGYRKVFLADLHLIHGSLILLLPRYRPPCPRITLHSLQFRPLHRRHRLLFGSVASVAQRVTSSATVSV